MSHVLISQQQDGSPTSFAMSCTKEAGLRQPVRKAYVKVKKCSTSQTGEKSQTLCVKSDLATSHCSITTSHRRATRIYKQETGRKSLQDRFVSNHAAQVVNISSCEQGPGFTTGSSHAEALFWDIQPQKLSKYSKSTLEGGMQPSEQDHNFPTLPFLQTGSQFSSQTPAAPNRIMILRFSLVPDRIAVLNLPLITGSQFWISLSLSTGSRFCNSNLISTGSWFCNFNHQFLVTLICLCNHDL